MFAGIDPGSFYTGLFMGFTICCFALLGVIRWMGE